MFYKLCIILNIGCIITGAIVKISTGYVNYTLCVSKNGRNFLAYYGIPYAAPPLGNLRLKPPTHAEPWNHVRESRISQICLQSESSLNSEYSVTLGQEDCLYLNVFTPMLSDRKGKGRIPVIVYIHGGSHTTGSANSYRPEYLLDYNIVLVTINYRLGALGFLSTINDVIPGNFGFKDQVFALKWVQSNIHQFGGNPNQVTLMGQSSGSASVNLHMFSPLSAGLFHRAILQSGSAFAAWNLSNRNLTSALSTAFITAVGCYRDNAVRVRSCLQNLPPEEFIRKEKALLVWNFEPITQFKAVVEGVEPVVDRKTWLQKIINIMKKHRTEGGNTVPFLPFKPGSDTYVNKVPFLIGQNSADGAFIAEKYLANGGKLAKEFNLNYRRLMPIVTKTLYISNSPEQMENIADRIKKYYFANDDIGPETDLQLVKFFTDQLFVYSMVQSVLSATDVPIYIYLYDHKNEYHLKYHNQTKKKDLGVSHGEELQCFFYSEKVDSQLNKNDRRICRAMRNYWINFATYGNPNGLRKIQKWEMTTPGKVEYLHIISKNRTMENNYFLNGFNFWNSLPLGIERFINL